MEGLEPSTYRLTAGCSTIELPRNTLNFFLELPRGYLSQDFSDFILGKGVSITPGTYFFDNLVDDRFFRINIANASIADLEKGISIISENLEEFFYEYKNKIELRSNKVFY